MYLEIVRGGSTVGEVLFRGHEGVA
jgi:hypothetical protein